MRLGFWMDWNDPDELRRLREELGEAPWKETTIQGTDGPVTDTVEMLVGRLGMPEIGGSYFTFSNENNDLIWGFLAECHKRGWIYKGHDSMPWCPRCGTGISQHEMTEGYQDREDPGPDRALPARRPAGRGAPRLDDDPLDARRERRGGGRAGPRLRPRPPGRGATSGSGRGRVKQAVVGRVRGARGEARAASSSAGDTRARSTTCPPFARHSTRARATTRHAVRAPGHPVDRGRRGRGHRHRPHRAGCRRRGLPARQEPRAPGDRADRRGRALLQGLRLAERASQRPRSPRRSSTTSSGAGSSTTWSRTPTATRTAGAAGRRCCSASSTSGSSRWARSTTGRATS